MTYAHQCAGLAEETREVDGFAVPLGDAEISRPLLSFCERFKGNPPRMDSPFGDVWTDALIEQLGRLVDAIPFWETHRSGDRERRLFLALDLLARSATRGVDTRAHSVRARCPRM